MLITSGSERSMYSCLNWLGDTGSWSPDFILTEI